LSSFIFDCSIEKNIFEHVIPSVVGHAKIIDKFLADPGVPYPETVRNHKISLQDDDDLDVFFL
jgi:hypothetical protein